MSQWSGLSPHEHAVAGVRREAVGERLSHCIARRHQHGSKLDPTHMNNKRHGITIVQTIAASTKCNALATARLIR